MMWILIRRVATTFVPLAARVASTSGVCRHDCEIFNTEILVGFTLSKHTLFEWLHAGSHARASKREAPRADGISPHADARQSVRASPGRISPLASGAAPRRAKKIGNLGVGLRAAYDVQGTKGGFTWT